MNMEEGVGRKPGDRQGGQVSAGRRLHSVCRQHPAICILRHLALALSKQRHNKEGCHGNGKAEATGFRLKPKEQ